MMKRLILGALLGVVAVLLMACEVEEEAEGPDDTPTQTTATAQATATAEATPTPAVPDPPGELERLRQEDDAKPKFQGAINGIRLYPSNAKSVPTPQWACTGARPEEIQHPDMSAVVGTALEIAPSYLPAGAEEIPASFGPSVCEAPLAYVQRDWVIQGKGDLYIIRYQGGH